MNWVSTENTPFFNEKARKASKEYHRTEKEKIKQGMKKIFIPHPTIPRTMIEKWVKDE